MWKLFANKNDLDLYVVRNHNVYCVSAVADESTDSVADDSQESSILDESNTQESPTKNEQACSTIWYWFLLQMYGIRNV